MKALKNYEFPTFGPRGVYDWDKILDGGIYEVIEGEDFTCAKITFNTLARSRARKRGKVLRTTSNADKTGYILQATPASPEKLAEWAAEDEAKRVAKEAGGEEVVEEVVDDSPKAPVKAKPGGKRR